MIASAIPGDREWADVTSYADAAARAAINDASAKAMRHKLAHQAGGISQFHRQVRIEQIGDAAAGTLDEFYAVLRAGILPDELVPIGDFVAALGPRNADGVFQQAIGPYHYFGLALRAPGEGTIGATGFAVFCHRRGPATLHASYYALLPRFRGLGLVRLLLDAVARTAVHFIARARPAAFDAGPVVQFIESNGIADMTLGNRLLDQAIAVHPLARDAMWERMGFREVMDIHYRQRSVVPIKLVLKAALTGVEVVPGYHRVRGMRPPTSIAGDLLLRHVSAFDNLLMNYDEASRALVLGRSLPDPETAGLVSGFGPGALLGVKPLDQAARERREWAAIDKRLSARTDLALDKTMRALRAEIGEVPSYWSASKRIGAADKVG